MSRKKEYIYKDSVTNVSSKMHTVYRLRNGLPCSRASYRMEALRYFLDYCWTGKKGVIQEDHLLFLIFFPFFIVLIFLNIRYNLLLSSLAAVGIVALFVFNRYKRRWDRKNTERKNSLLTQLRQAPRENFLTRGNHLPRQEWFGPTRLEHFVVFVFCQVFLVLIFLGISDNVVFKNSLLLYLLIEIGIVICFALIKQLAETEERRRNRKRRDRLAEHIRIMLEKCGLRERRERRKRLGTWG